MRINEEHDYDDRVINIEDTLAHTLQEYRFRCFVKRITLLKGQVGGFYALITLMAYLYPSEFPPERVEAMKKLTYKVFAAYHEDPPIRYLVKLMQDHGYKPAEIASALKIKRENVYYYTKKSNEQEVPLQCMLTYGEYDLMMDFMDAWDRTTKLGVLE